jgi:hypothetical protein
MEKVTGIVGSSCQEVTAANRGTTRAADVSRENLGLLPSNRQPVRESQQRSHF